MRNWIALASSCALAACAADATVATSTTDQEVTADNGTSLNGTSLNGTSLNGTSLNGTSLNGTSLNGTSLNGTSLNGTSLNGTSLNGTSLNGTSLNGTDFIGATMTGTLSNGASITLRIDDIDALASPNDDVLAYAVSAQVDGGWARLCGDEPDGSAVRAIPVAGTWDASTGAWTDSSSSITFACRHASIAKCVELGYKSWDGYAGQHHACVRLLRADYCGDGVSHTVNGTLINLYDNVGVQADTESWGVDAEWTADGALCFNHYRGGSLPSACSQKYSTGCGSFSGGALLIDEYNN
jgi:ADYC domain-containing protein/pentapeptide repeat protein